MIEPRETRKKIAAERRRKETPIPDMHAALRSLLAEMKHNRKDANASR